MEPDCSAYNTIVFCRCFFFVYNTLIEVIISVYKQLLHLNHLPRNSRHILAAVVGVGIIAIKCLL